MPSSKKPYLFSLSETKTFDRGNGVITRLYANAARCGAEVTTGTTQLPPGKSVALHTHNCDEQIIILQGRAEAEFNGERHPVGPLEAVYIPAGVVHGFHNVGDEPMVMVFIYDAGEVTRTFAATGETVVHLSDSDVAQPKS